MQGTATAIRLHGEGARVALLDLQPPKTLPRSLRNDNHLGYFSRDVTDRPSVEAAFDQIIQKYMSARHVEVNKFKQKPVGRVETQPMTPVA